MLDLGFVIDAEAVPISIMSTGGGYDADGIWQPAAPVTTATRGTIQPANGRQLMDMPEGVRTEARYLLWTRSALAEGDTVLYGIMRYRVVFLWPRPEGSFYRAALGLMK